MRMATMLCVLGAALACGGQESDPGVGAGPGDAPLSVSAESCLELVEKGLFDEAIPACTDALAEAPGNRALADALEQARVGIATGAAEARAAAEEASGGTR